ncbi:MAG: DUF4358 domain-containing protein [Clostridiales bacterium]|nr:DUF4358 domain-containing protein [Clostridiales bacterium]
MKKFLSLALVFVLVLSLSSFLACNKDPKPAGDPVTVAQLWESVKAVSGFSEMTAVPERDYMEVYGIDSTKLAESVWYMSENPSLNADECAIFKLSDTAYAGTLAEILKGRIARQLSVAESYSPEEATKLKNAEVVTEGSFVYYCVGDNAEAMMNVIRTANK